MSLNLRQCDILYRPDIQRSGAIVAKDEMLHSEPKGVVTFHANIDRPNLRMIPVPGRKCPVCLAKGQTVWVVPGKRCPKCGTEVN